MRAGIPLEQAIRTSVAAAMRTNGLSLRDMATLLTEHGWPVSHAVVQKITAVKGGRPIAVEEWLLLADALGRAPLDLATPDPRGQYQVGSRAYSAEDIHAWVGREAIHRRPDPGGLSDTLRGFADEIDATHDRSRLIFELIDYLLGALRAQARDLYDKTGE